MHAEFANMHVIAISNLPGQVYTIYSLPVACHGSLPCNLLLEGYTCARMVYWYVLAVEPDCAVLFRLHFANTRRTCVL